MGADEPTRRRVTLAHKNGLHLSPITELVKKASQFASEVRICFDGKEASAKSAVELMLLGATHGAELTIEASGADADPAVRAVSEILETRRD
ncbi:MAG: HPr family phosphocarrier protein [Fuerstiella sp.]